MKETRNHLPTRIEAGTQAGSPRTFCNPFPCRNCRQSWDRRRTDSVKLRHRNG